MRRTLLLIAILKLACPVNAQTFHTTGTLNQARSSHTATLLGNGTVLVTGGITPSGPTSSAEIYDPVAGSWRYAAHSLNIARTGHTATLMDNGQVLIAGGATTGNAPIGSAEIFDPSTESFLPTASLLAAVGRGSAFNVGSGRVVFIQVSTAIDVEIFTTATRKWTHGTPPPSGAAGPTMALLNNGTIFMCGGASPAVYSPNADSWQSLSASAAANPGQTATTLPSGQVFLASGYFSTSSGAGEVLSTQVYDQNPSPAGTATPGPDLSFPAPGGIGFASTLMGNGSVLISGGGYNPAFGAVFMPVANAAVYNPQINTVSFTGQMNVSRTYHTATPLPNGLVLIAGGLTDQSGTITPVAELFGYGGFPAQPTSFIQTGSLMVARTSHKAANLASGSVLITGGTTAQQTITQTAEIYDPTARTFRFTKTPMLTPRVGHSVAMLPDGRVLIAGGTNGQQSGLATTEIFDPASEVFTAGPPMNHPRSEHQSVTLTDGRVMVIGGHTDFFTNTVEIYDPVQATWAVVTPLPSTREYSAATLLLDGRVFISGGINTANGNDSGAVYSYSVAANTWTTMAPLLQPRLNHWIITLTNGKVLIGGGSDNSGVLLNASELYDPEVLPNGLSVNAGTVAAGYAGAPPVALADGTVWVSGGQAPRWNGSVVCDIGSAAVELFNPNTNSWTDLSSMLIGRGAFSASLLPSGQILAAGGLQSSCPATSSSFGSLIMAIQAELWTGIAPSTGTIQVTTNLPGATFTITGPATYSASGTSFTQTNAPSGVYTITYRANVCYTAPAPQTFMLTAGSSIKFAGTYQGAVTLSVGVAPVGASSATFSISPPVPGLKTIPPYPVTQTGVIPQAYTVAFNQVLGFNTPQQQTLNPDSSCNLSFSGVYTASFPTGTAILSVALNTNQGGFTISSISTPGFPPISGGGSFTASVPSGTYQITFSDIVGYYKPAPQTVTVKPDASVQVNGYYQRLLVVAFTGFDTAPNPSNCFGLGPLHTSGSGVTYTTPQTKAGVTEIVPEIDGLVPGILPVPALEPGITGAAFTFYGNDESGILNGDACTAPGGNPDHIDAENWLAAQNPTAFDKIAIIGHSYGGNRARLFVEQLRKRKGWIADLLVTVDAIEWSRCNIPNVISANNPLSEASKDCIQTKYTSSDIPASSANSSFSFYQTNGVRPFLITLPFIEGYAVPGATSQQVTTANVEHLSIDIDPGVDQTIRTLMLNLIRNPAVIPIATAPTRIGGQLVAPIILSVTGISTATAVQITSASLNGVSASNLALLSNLGDLPSGSSFHLSLIFPGSAAQSGKTVVLTVNGQHTSGLPFLLSKHISVP